MSSTWTVVSDNGCPYCNNGIFAVYHRGICPKVKSIEYFPDGRTKKVEFKDDKEKQFCIIDGQLRPLSNGSPPGFMPLSSGAGIFNARK